jgi:dTMP kinase
MKTFIVIDGGEGVGKTTVMARLRQAYPEAVFTREPGGTPFAEQLRGVILDPVGKDATLLAQHLLFWSARADHVARLVRPALDHVVAFCDRFDSSTYAYQVQSRLSPLNKLFWETRAAVLGGITPHYVFLDTDEAISFARVQKRSSVTNEAMTHFDASSLEEHKKTPPRI